MVFFHPWEQLLSDFQRAPTSRKNDNVKSKLSSANRKERLRLCVINNIGGAILRKQLAEVMFTDLLHLEQ